MAGIQWLLDLQNRDGGIPTFCRGWGALPFDRSSPDLTAHALRGWAAWLERAPADLQSRIRRSIVKAMSYLKQSQRHDGSWVPLWFGNQFAPEDQNPTYGTARVLVALLELGRRKLLTDRTPIEKGIRWLLKSQNSDGGWSGFVGGGGSVEETALAVEALAIAAMDCLENTNGNREPAEIRAAALRGALRLIQDVENGSWTNPSPIGFYFAKLWYFEKLYPMIFTVSALNRLARLDG
jgi:squalene-hopene/tetraprenyl-beta-curcumene cyclase